MPRKTTARSARKTFIEQLEQHLKAPSSKKRPAAPTPRSKERLLNHYQERLVTTVAAREQAIARYDQEIERCQDLVRGLEKELGKKASKPAAKRARKRAAPRKKARSSG